MSTGTSRVLTQKQARIIIDRIVAGEPPTERRAAALNDKATLDVLRDVVTSADTKAILKMISKAQPGELRDFGFSLLRYLVLDDRKLSRILLGFWKDQYSFTARYSLLYRVTEFPPGIVPNSILLEGFEMVVGNREQFAEKRRVWYRGAENVLHGEISRFSERAGSVSTKTWLRVLGVVGVPRTKLKIGVARMRRTVVRLNRLGDPLVELAFHYLDELVKTA